MPIDVRAAANALERLDARSILEWVVERYPGRVAVSVSFGGGGLVLAHMLSEIDRSVPVLFLDTGYHFAETLAFKERFAARYGLRVVDLTPDHDPGPLYASDPDRCCDIRKVQPMARALRDADVWASALRRDQSPTRASIGVAEPYPLGHRTILKVHPLATWTAVAVRQYLRDHDVPHHPLLDRGYTSIGCWPCTRPTLPGEHDRAGRWSGTRKTECGLHTRRTNDAPERSP